MILLGGIVSARAQTGLTVAYSANTNGPAWAYNPQYVQGGGLNIGHQFYIGANMTVYSLGAYDFGGDGLVASHTVTIFSNIPNSDTYVPLGDCTITVPAGTNTVLNSGFRFQPLNTPVIITPGVYVVMAFQMNENSDMVSDYETTGTSLNGSGGFYDKETYFQYRTNAVPSSGFVYDDSNPNDLGSASFTYVAGGTPGQVPAGHPCISPSNPVVNVGQTISLVASNGGTAPFTYQWYYGANQTPINGATNPTLVLSNIQTNQTVGNAGVYWVSAQNAYGGPTFNLNTEVVSVNPVYAPDVPVITPTNVVTGSGQSVTLTASDNGTTPILYQWYYDGAILSGATNSVLALTNLQTSQTPGNAGNYSVSAQNVYGGPVSSAYAVSVTVNNTTPVNTPTISPATNTVNAGQNVTLTAVDSGALPIVYQWYYSSALVTISGATNATLVLTNVQPIQSAGNAGNYYVSALNAYAGPILSTTYAQVNVVSTNLYPVGNPVITPASVLVNSGRTVTLSVTDSGTTPIHYQWYYGAGLTPIPGATNSSLVLPNVQTNQAEGSAGVYSVSAQNSISGPVYTTNAVTVAVIPNAAPYKVMPLGDSITDGFRGYGGYRAPLYQFFANANFSFTFVGSQNDNSVAWLPYPDHEGISGSEINSVASGFTTWGPEFGPDIVLLLIGTNDYANDQNGNDSYAAGAITRLDALVQEIATNQPNADLFVANLTLRTDNSGIESAIETTFNPFVPGIVSNHYAMGQHVYFVDMHSALGASDLSDGLHPNQTGYNKMAVVWYNAVTSVLPPPPPPAPTLAVTATNVTATYQAVPGFEYFMQRSTSLGGPWENLGTNTIPTNGLFQVTDTFGDLGGRVPSTVFYQPTLILY